MKAVPEVPVTGTIISQFLHHTIIVLPGGRTFQVPKSAVMDLGNGNSELRSDAKIEHVFPDHKEGKGPAILVPETVLKSLREFEKATAESSKTAAA